MSVSSVTTRGYGSAGSSALVVTAGYAGPGAAAAAAAVLRGGSSKRRARQKTIRPLTPSEYDDWFKKRWPVIPPPVAPEPQPFTLDEFYEDDEDEAILIALFETMKTGGLH